MLEVEVSLLNGDQGAPVAGGRRRSRGSLRSRVTLWNAAVMAATLTALMLAAIHEERGQIVRTEAAHARALLEHLARMPEFQGDIATVRSHLELMRESLRASGDALALAPRAERILAPEDPGTRLVATRSLSLRQGEFDLRYVSDGDRIRRSLRRSVAMHILYGLVALAALVAGTEWILRANLVVPLRSLSRQLDHMRDGRGWLAHPPHTDEELSGVARAVGDLGPALERQVNEWIQAERRAAVALALRSIRSRLRESEDQAAAGASAVVQAERDRYARLLADEERAAFASQAHTAAGG